MADPTPQQQLTALFKRTGKAHHKAFLETDGADPDWPLWYAEFLHDKLPDILGTAPTRSQIVHFLVEADRRHAAASSEAPWPRYYARLFLRELGPSTD
jgi:NAD(P)H-hydrate epimerase